jgi:hypothetical protein
MTLHGQGIRRLKRHAVRNPWDGRTALPPGHRAVWPDPDEPEKLFSILLSYDVGHHSSGWWRNSLYERCLHLSLTIMKRGVASLRGALETPTQAEMQAVARAFFGEDVAKAWIEPPAGAFDAYRNAPQSGHCWHIRLFTDAAGNPIHPEGEVYDLVPFSDGTSPEKVFR